mgnify:CR=1 FL=1
MNSNTVKQVVSKNRVHNHGEVLTAEREVSDMIALVEHETERIESRFLEPACGTGNFLLPVLERKLQLVRKRYGKSQMEFERVSAVAVGSLYGVELLLDNAEVCRQRLFQLFDHFYTNLYKDRAKDQLRDTVRFILKKNIVEGDALSLQTTGDNPKPITFSEWSLVNGSYVKRRDYTFEELIPKNVEDQSLFEGMKLSDINEPVFTPKPIKEYPLVHVSELQYETDN